MAIYTDLNSTAVELIRTDLTGSGDIESIQQDIRTSSTNLFDINKSWRKTGNITSLTSNGTYVTAVGYGQFLTRLYGLEPNTSYYIKYSCTSTKARTYVINAGTTTTSTNNSGFTFTTGNITDTDVCTFSITVGGTSSVTTTIGPITLVKGTTAPSDTTFVPPLLERVNLICLPVFNVTEEGITFEHDGQGTFKVHGTSTAAFVKKFELIKSFSFDDNTNYYREITGSNGGGGTPQNNIKYGFYSNMSSTTVIASQSSTINTGMYKPNIYDTVGAFGFDIKSGKTLNLTYKLGIYPYFYIPTQFYPAGYVAR